MPDNIYDKDCQNWMKGVLGLKTTKEALCEIVDRLNVRYNVQLCIDLGMLSTRISLLKSDKMRVDIHNKDFQNWIKGVLALKTTRDAVLDTLREKLESFVLKYEKSDIQTFTDCLESNHNRQLKTKKQLGKWREKVEKRTYTCKHKQCKKLFDDFVDKHKGIQKKNFKWYLNLNEENTNEENRVEKNTNEHDITEENTNKEKKVGENTNKFELTEGKTETLWQISRLYMFYEGEHDDKYKGLDDLDISNLIKIMKNCAICEVDGDPKLYDKVLEFRNEMMHSPDNIIARKYLQEKLEEASSLIQLISTDDQVTPIKHRLEGAVQYLENLGENEFQISFPFEEYQRVFREAKQILEDKPNREGLKQLQELFKTNTSREPTDISKKLVGKPRDFKVLVQNCIEKKREAIELDIALRSQAENADHEIEQLQKLHCEIEQDWNDINEELKKTEEEDLANLLECLRKENATIKTERDKAFRDNAVLNKENESLKGEIRYLGKKVQVKEMEIDSLKKQLSKMESEEKPKMMEIDTLNRKLRQKEREIEDLERTKNELIADLNRILANMEDIENIEEEEPNACRIS